MTCDCKECFEQKERRVTKITLLHSMVALELLLTGFESMKQLFDESNEEFIFRKETARFFIEEMISLVNKSNTVIADKIVGSIVSFKG